MKIVALDYHTLNPGDLDDANLCCLGDFVAYPHSTKQEGLQRAADAEILILNKWTLGAEDISQLKHLKFVCVSATGYNNIDLDAARQNRIVVSNVAAYSTASVVQHVFSLIFSITNRVAAYSNEVKNNVWSNQKHFSYWHTSIHELQGKTLGILGYGGIAKEVAKVARSFGMNILVHHRTQLENYPAGISWCDREDLFRQSDILSLNAQLTEDTFHIVCTKSLSLMKSNAIIINTARGPLIDEKALYSALQSKQIKAAGLDVLSEEPPAAYHPLFSLDNCIITPHQAWCSLESRKRLLDGVVRNLQSYMNNTPVNVVSG